MQVVKNFASLRLKKWVTWITWPHLSSNPISSFLFQRADYLGSIPSGCGAVPGFSTTITLCTSIIWVVSCFQINVIYNMQQISQDSNCRKCQIWSFRPGWERAALCFVFLFGCKRGINRSCLLSLLFLLLLSQQSKTQQVLCSQTQNLF